MINAIANIIGASGAGINAGATNSISTTNLGNFVQANRWGSQINAYSLVPSLVNVTNYKWELIDSDTGALVELSFQKDPIFLTPTLTPTVKTHKFYDLKVTVTTPTDSLPQYWRRGIVVLPVRPLTWGDCDIKIDLDATPTGYFNNFDASETGVTNPDLTIGIKGTSTSGNLEFAGLHGTSGHPVRIINYGAVVNHTVGGGGLAHALYLEQSFSNGQGCKYIMIDGYAANGAPGIQINGAASGSATQTVYADGITTDIQFFGIKVDGGTLATGAAVSMEPPTPVSGFNATNFTALNLVFYQNIITNAGQEGHYIYRNNDNPASGFYYIKHKGTVIMYNNYNGVGRDFIQPGAGINVEVGHNTGANWGKKQDTGGQENAISWNGGTNGWCFRNSFIGGKKFLEIQSGNRPWDIQAGETTPRHNYFFGNTFANGTYTAGGDVQPYAIFIQNLNGSGNSGPWNNYIFNNTFYTDKKLFGQQYWANSFSSDKNTFVNNIGDKTGSPEIEYTTNDMVVCDVATTANITLAGFQTIDGIVNPVVVLVKDQTVQTQNGIYFMSGGAWARHNNADTSGEVEFLQAIILSGTVNTGTIWYQTTVTPTLGVSNLVFSQRFTNLLMNNLLRNLGSNDSDLQFINAPSNLNIPITSIAYSGSPTNIATRIPELPTWAYYDLLGMPLTQNGTNYFFGAYSGYNKRLIPYVPIDSSPATFTTPVNMSSIGNFGGTLGFETDKIGRLYYAITTTNTQLTEAQIVTGVGAIQFGTIGDLGTAESKLIAGLSQATTYYIQYFFKTVDFIKTTPTQINFTTTADVVAPTISNIRILDANRDRVYFDTSEPVTASTITGFTLASPSKTIGSISIIPGATTGHYLSLSTPYVQADFGTSPTLAYAGGSNFVDLANNALATFGATAITNNIVAASFEDVTQGTSLNGALSGSGGATQWDSTGAGGMVSAKKTVANSGWKLRFKWNTLMNGAFTDCRVGIVLSSNVANFVSAYSAAQELANFHFQTNSNIDTYNGNTYAGVTIGGQQNTNNFFEIIGDSAGNVTSRYGTDGITWTTGKSYGNLTSGAAIQVAISTGITGKRVVNLQFQGDKGLV